MKKLINKIDNWLDEDVIFENHLWIFETNNYTLTSILIAVIILMTVVTTLI